MKKLCLLFLSIFMALGFVACGGVQQSNTQYTLTLSENVDEGGSVTGEGTYAKGATATLTAVPNEGYEFVGWYNGDALYANSATCTITLTANVTLTAKWALKEYAVSITKNIPEAGNVTGAGEYTHGAQVTLTATTNAHYTFEGWYDGANLLGEDATYVFTATSNSAIVAKWSAEHFHVNVTQNLAEAGEVTGMGSYAYNTQATLIATTNDGYVFMGWFDSADQTITNESTYTFTVTGETTVKAKWTEEVSSTTYAVSAIKNVAAAGDVAGEGNYELNATATLTATTNYGYTFEGWYNGNECLESSETYTFTVTGETTVTAKWIANEYTVSVTKNIDTAGEVTGTGDYEYNTQATLTATENYGFIFDGWYNGSELLSANPEYTFDVTQAMEITAKWTRETYAVSVTKNIPEAGNVTGANDYEYDTQATLTATANEGYTFDGWYNGSECLESSATYTFTVTKAETVTAKFSLKKYAVSVTKNIPEAGDVTGADDYEYNTQATLTATTNYGYTFDGWYNGSECLESSETYTFTVTGETTVTAKWIANEYTVSITKNTDAAGEVTGAGDYEYNTNATLTATVTKGHVFDGWFDSEDQLLTKETVYTFPVTADTTVKAKWSVDSSLYTITVANDDASAGSVTGGGEFYAGESVTVTATPNAEYVFDGWYVGDECKNTQATYQFYASETITLTAKWSVKKYAITIEKNIAAAGTVTGDGSFVKGAQVTLTATDNDGYQFVGWYDGNTQLATTRTYSFNVTGEQTITAQWSEIEYTATFQADGTSVGTETFTVSTESLTEPDVPEKAGYTGAWESYTLGLDDIVINAVYTPITYTATFQADGAIVGTKTFTVLTESLTEPDVPEKAGYTGAWESYTLGVADIVINATYTIIEYKATFMSGNETVATIPFTILTKDSVTAPQVPEKAGYTGAWENYQLSLANRTVNAVYTPIAYKVTLLSDGATVKTYDYNVETATFALSDTPSEKDGYKFEGWYDGDTKMTQIVKGTVGNLTLNAKWSEVEYTITFQANGTTVNTQTFTISTMDDVTAPSVPEKAGYTGAWENYQLSLANRTVNAVYTPITYTITYVDEFNVTHSNPTTYTVESATITLAAMKKEGYTFVGWYNGDTKVTEIVKGTTGDIKLTAKWEVDVNSPESGGWSGIV